MLLGTKKQVSSPHSPIQTLIQILYYTMVGGERKFIDVRVVGWRVALLCRGEQVIDKERDIREVRSGTHILSNGPAHPQPMSGVLLPLAIGGRYLPFMLVLDVHARRIFHSSLGWSRCWHELKYSSFANVLFPFLTACSRVRSRFNHTGTRVCLGRCYVQVIVFNSVALNIL